MTPEQVFAGVAHRPGSVWLDGADTGWSILTWDPVDQWAGSYDWVKVGRAGMRSRAPSDVPFESGILGYVGFGAGHWAEPVPVRPSPIEPESCLFRYEGALCFRHADGSWHPAGSQGFRSDAARLLREAAPLPPVPAPTGGPVRTDARQDWEQRVQRVREWLASGDCYQVNLTRPVWVADAGPPYDAYRRLRTRPAAYGAFLRVDDRLVVLSNSPELLLEKRGSRLRSLPIKGTRPRGPNPAEDEELARALANSLKDQAELTMIVDLVRHDLGKVAQVGTVVAGTRTLTAHPTVHHASWPVTAELAPSFDAWDSLAAVFPPGSVTGAPKVRACERIAMLEPAPRGVYCGAIGYVADSGDATWSVAIRVAVFSGSEARYHVGGGIVFDSDPAAEWEETVVKEAALRRALVAERENP